MWGPANTGKTELAKALLAPSPLLVTQLDDLKHWDEDLYTGILYDEADLSHLPRTAQIHHLSVTEPVSTYARFYNASLTANRKVVLTSNHHPREIMLFDEPAIRRRVQVVHVRALNVYEPWDLDTAGPIGIHMPTGGSTSTQCTLVE